MNNSPGNDSISADIRRLSVIPGTPIPAMPYIAPKISYRGVKKTPRLRAPVAPKGAAAKRTTPGGAAFNCTPPSTPHSSQSIARNTICEIFGEVWGPTPTHLAGDIRWPAEGDRPCIIIVDSPTETAGYVDQTLVIHTPLSDEQRSVAHIASIVRSLSTESWALSTLSVLPTHAPSRAVSVRGRATSYVISTGIPARSTRGRITAVK